MDLVTHKFNEASSNIPNTSHSDLIHLLYGWAMLHDSRKPLKGVHTDDYITFVTLQIRIKIAEWNHALTKTSLSLILKLPDLALF